MKNFFLAATLAALCFVGCHRPTAEVSSTRETVVPDVRTISSDALIKDIQAQGQPVIINFWATWCPPCVEEMPLFVSFYQENSSKFAFFSVSVDDPESIEDRVRPFVQRSKINFPVFVLSDRSPERIADALKLEWQGELPATIFFDKEGTLVRKQFEQIDHRWLNDCLALLK